MLSRGRPVQVKAGTTDHRTFTVVARPIERRSGLTDVIAVPLQTRCPEQLAFVMSIMGVHPIADAGGTK